MKLARKKSNYLSLITLSLITIANISSAELPPAINLNALRSNDAGLLGQTISTMSAPERKKVGITTLTQKREAPMSTPIAGAEKIQFTLKEVKISGNHVISTADLGLIFKPYINEKITLAKLLELVNAITAEYHKQGYFLSEAILPPQNFDQDQGIIKIQVVEGYINHINVQGIPERQQKLLAPYIAAITQVRPIKYSVLERYLLLINDLPGIDAQAVIAPDPNTPLASELTLISQYTPFQAALSYDNYGTRYLGPQETTLHTAINSAIIPGGTLYTNILVTANPDMMKYAELTHNQALGSNGLVWGLGSYYVETHPQFTLTPLDMYGNSTDVYTNLSYPILRSRKRSLYIKTNFEYLDSRSTILSQELYFDRIRDISLSTNYQDNIWHGSDNLNLAVYDGFKILGAGDSGPLSRAEGNSEFVKATLSLSREQSLGKRFSLYGLMTSQYANVPLVAAEEFTFGGPYLGEGYDFAQFSGDEGFADQIELRMNTDPNLKILKQVQYYAFYDNGVVWNLDKITNAKKVSAASAGLGFRASIMSHLSAEAFLAKPLTAPNATQVALHEDGHAILGYFQIVISL